MTSNRYFSIISTFGRNLECNQGSEIIQISQFFRDDSLDSLFLKLTAFFPAHWRNYRAGVGQVYRFSMLPESFKFSNSPIF